MAKQRWSNEFNLSAGRDAFRSGGGNRLANHDENMDVDELRRQQFIMRSFTESIEMDDLPQAPELPPNLDIDHYAFDSDSMHKSSTADTIVEVTKKPDPDKIDKTKGETQKYVMTVPGPEQVDQEIEMHKSLMKPQDSDENASPSTSAAIYQQDPDHAALRREYSNTIKQRPRPTTPTSGSVIERYVEEKEKSSVKDRSLPPDSGAKIKVSIPGHENKGHRPRKSSMSWSDFYETMASQIPMQARSGSFNMGKSQDYDEDIIEQNPEYKEKAPPAPVVHRRTSVEWENFEESREQYTSLSRNMETDTSDQVVPDTDQKEFLSNEKPISTPPVSPSNNEELPTTSEDTSRTIQKAAEKLSHEEEVPEAETAVPVATEDYGAYGEGYDQNYPNGYGSYGAEYDTSAYGYSGDQTSTAYDPNSTDNQYGYDQNYYSSTGYDYTGYDTSQYDQTKDTYDASQTYDNTQTYNTDAYGQQQEYNANTQAYGTDYYGTGYDYSAYGTEQAGTAGSESYNYDASQYGTEQAAATTEGEYPAAEYSTEQYGYDPATGAYKEENGDYNYSNYYGSHAYDYSSSGYEDTSQYGQEVAPGSENYDTSQYGAPPTEATSAPLLPITTQSIFGQPQPKEHDPYAWEETTFAPPPPLPTQPVFGAAPPKEADPFSWEAQATPASTLPPPRPPPASTTPVYETATEEHTSRVDQEKPKAAPPRPAPPLADKKQPPRPPAPSPVRPPPPSAKSPVKAAEPEQDEDPWAKFRAMTEQVTNVVKSTGEKMKTLEESSAAKDIKDESYMAQIGGTQGMLPPHVQRQIAEMEAEKKRAKEEKKQAKKQGKRAPSPTFDPKKEEDLDRAAAELAMKLAANRMDLGEWKPPSEREKEEKAIEKAETPIKTETSVRVDNISVKDDTRHKSSIAVSEDLPPLSAKSGAHSQLNFQVSSDSGYQPIGDVVSPGIATAVANNWAGFDGNFALPTSDSDFFSQAGTVDKPVEQDPFATSEPFDPFAPVQENLLIEDNYDPFDVRPVEDILEQAKQKAAIEAAKQEAQEDLEFYGGRPSSRLSTPTPEGGSPASARPIGFEDDFRAVVPDDISPTPLYDEDDSEPLVEWPPKFEGEGWELVLRHPLKKKLMADRVWKPCYVRLRDNMVYIFNSKQDSKPFQEIMLQATYSLSDVTLQAYDAYGKIHAVKLQVVFYKERVGIRAGQITRLVEGHITKYGLPLEHAAQCTVLAKFGSLNGNDLHTFTNAIEDVLFRCVARREVNPIYKQDEVQIHCYDEYEAHVDKDGIVSDQKARVRMFCLAFLTGSPFLEIGLNDRRRQGKEIVRRKDILPMYTERWIRFENLDFHCSVDKDEWDREQVIKICPLDGCFFEVMRFRVRPPKNREKPLTVKCLMKIAGSKIEIRIEAMAAAQQQRARGTTESIRTIPCEDIQIRFPIPEAWIYIFREERTWGVGSVHSKTRRPGKVKNLKDRIMGAVQHTEQTLIEVATGEAKYEHVYRSLVWRIPRLPEKHHAAYKSHLLKCRFDLSSFDLMPESFLPNCEVEFTMPLATISNTVVRSISVEQHEDSDRVEKFVRYVAKCQYKIEIDYVQCNDLDNDAIFEPSMVGSEMAISGQQSEHKPMFDPSEVAAQHEGYRIDLPEQPPGATNPFGKSGDSSSDEEDVKRPLPIIQIDMKGYGY
uniref:Uncharacterized protein n=1 Tax=Acrobeloides nanus TaxID=290746 RepID=A0A914CC02_9BILA